MQVGQVVREGNSADQPADQQLSPRDFVDQLSSFVPSGATTSHNAGYKAQFPTELNSTPGGKTSEKQIQPRLEFLFFPGEPQGLAGNLDSWRKTSIFSTSSEFHQWVEARGQTFGPGPGPRNDEDELADSQLKLLNHESGRYILRQLRNGKFLAFGQHAMDRQTSEAMIDRRYAWHAAIDQRTQARNTHDGPQRETTRHNCEFCNDAEDSVDGPTWLYDRDQKTTISVRKEFPNGAPKYDVLSYTWGRASSSKWIDVDGIPWKIRSSDGLPISHLLEVLGNISQRYVWVDILCIPQTCPNAKAREVARQARIFRDAVGGIAWLHQMAAVIPLVFGLLSWAMLAREQAEDQRGEPISPPVGTFAALEELFSDPWFSSTWTLQEAILRPNMEMRGVEEWPAGLFFPHGILARSIRISDVTVALFRESLNLMRAIASSSIKLSLNRGPIVSSNTQGAIWPRDAMALEKLLQDMGLYGLVTPTPAAILSSAKVRTSVKPHDKFYGIQSVFDIGMQGDYERSVESVRAEFLSRVWSRYAPVLMLALNRPVKTSGSADFFADTEDTLLWFSYAQLVNGKMSCLPPGYSRITATVTADGDPSFASVESINDSEGPWRYEASSTPEAHSKIVVVRFGLPPVPVTIGTTRDSEQLYKANRPGKETKDEEAQPPSKWFPKIANKILSKRRSRNTLPEKEITLDQQGKTSFMDRTTRLLYVGQIINEVGHLGLRRNPYVYMEYYLKAPGEGHRVGAMLSDLPFGHRKVPGALTLK